MRRLLLLVPVAALLAGCSRDDTKEFKGRTVDLDMTEYRVSPLTSVVDGAGPVRLRVRNDGSHAHNITLSKKGNIVLGRTTTIQRGQTSQIDLSLSPGTYRVFSSLSNDDTLGLNGYLVVR
jgi:hypothetical protein